MNWRAADKVATWRAFKQRMNVIFVADQVPEERQWALILVAGGDEATAGTLLKRESRIARRWNRYGMHSRRASNNQPHFGISETRTWQTSDKTNRRQRLTWISASSRLSGVPMEEGIQGGANDRLAVPCHHLLRDT